MENDFVKGMCVGAHSVNENLRTVNTEEKWLPKVDLSHLGVVEQKGSVEDLLRNECRLFSKNDSDIGDIEEFKVETPQN